MIPEEEEPEDSDDENEEVLVSNIASSKDKAAEKDNVEIVIQEPAVIKQK